MSPSLRHIAEPVQAHRQNDKPTKSEQEVSQDHRHKQGAQTGISYLYSHSPLGSNEYSAFRNTVVHLRIRMCR